MLDLRGYSSHHFGEQILFQHGCFGDRRAAERDAANSLHCPHRAHPCPVNSVYHSAQTEASPRALVAFGF